MLSICSSLIVFVNEGYLFDVGQSKGFQNRKTYLSTLGLCSLYSLNTIQWTQKLFSNAWPNSRQYVECVLVAVSACLSISLYCKMLPTNIQAFCLTFNIFARRILYIVHVSMCTNVSSCAQEVRWNITLNDLVALTDVSWWVYICVHAPRGKCIYLGHYLIFWPS